ncbi:MAG: hypothetical protein OJF49_001017 [Ktedonobacterales bacterium]|jgi:uncharacterized membrane protein|nr:MAG: hypothetical protein OJF49_001017 [Ktedonobacterales bacterium]
MGAFIQFMQSHTGRLVRIVAGGSLMIAGIWLVGGVWGVVLAVIGAVPVVAGAVGICLIAPLFGYELSSE